MNYEEAKKVMHLALRNVEVLKKLGWKWKLKTRQNVLYKGGLGLIDNFCLEASEDFNKLINVSTESGEFIPIIDWREIERFLNESKLKRYKLFLRPNKESLGNWICKIAKHIGYSKLVGDVEDAKSRQEAVMRAVNMMVI